MAALSSSASSNASWITQLHSRFTGGSGLGAVECVYLSQCALTVVTGRIHPHSRYRPLLALCLPGMLDVIILLLCDYSTGQDTKYVTFLAGHPRYILMRTLSV